LRGAIADSNHRQSSSSAGRLYADNLTDSMAKAIEETERRRHSVGITRSRPQPILKKSTNSILSFLEVRRLNAQQLETVYEQVDDMPLEQILNYSTGSADEGSSEELGV